MNVLIKHRKIVGISDMIVSDDSDDLIVTYSLGSCLGIVLYDPVALVGGMVHIMLPDSSIEKLSKNDVAFNPFKYIDTGVPKLFKACADLGMSKRNVCMGVFGGAQIFDREDFFNIGKRNYATLRKMLWKLGVLINHEHVGGRVHRTVKLDMKTGEIIVDVNKEQVITYNCALRK